jgi:hypothetical protein
VIHSGTDRCEVRKSSLERTRRRIHQPIASTNAK